MRAILFHPFNPSLMLSAEVRHPCTFFSLTNFSHMLLACCCLHEREAGHRSIMFGQCILYFIIPNHCGRNDLQRPCQMSCLTTQLYHPAVQATIAFSSRMPAPLSLLPSMNLSSGLFLHDWWTTHQSLHAVAMQVNDIPSPAAAAARNLATQHAAPGGTPPGNAITVPPRQQPQNMPENPPGIVQPPMATPAARGTSNILTELLTRSRARHQAEQARSQVIGADGGATTVHSGEAVQGESSAWAGTSAVAGRTRSSTDGEPSV